MYIYNITFVIHPEREREFMDWISGKALRELVPEKGKARNPRLQTVIEAGGEKPGPDHGLSVAFQAEFDTEEDAKAWECDTAPAALKSFMATFGPQAAFFCTLLAAIDL